MNDTTGTPIRVFRSKEQRNPDGDAAGWLLAIIAHEQHYHAMVSQCLSFSSIDDAISFVDEFKQLLHFADGIEFDDITDEAPTSLMPY